MILGAGSADTTSIAKALVRDLGSGNIPITGSGTTINGEDIMMLISGAGGNHHAVVVTGTEQDGSGGIKINYYDPTRERHSYVMNNNYSGFYAVSGM